MQSTHMALFYTQKQNWFEMNMFWIMQLKSQNTTAYYVLPHDIYSYAEQNEDLTITVTDCFLFSMKINILKMTSLQTVTQQIFFF